MKTPSSGLAGSERRLSKANSSGDGLNRLELPTTADTWASQTMLAVPLAKAQRRQQQKKSSISRQSSISRLDCVPAAARARCPVDYYSPAS